MPDFLEHWQAHFKGTSGLRISADISPVNGVFHDERIPGYL